MLEKIRDKIRNKIRGLEYVMTIHAEEEMENDDLSIFDIENAILNGEIVERQDDVETGERKYLVGGRTFNDDAIIIVAKLSLTDKLVIIKVYREGFEEYDS
jgi:Domain of unknown function (DUF4258)